MSIALSGAICLVVYLYTYFHLKNVAGKVFLSILCISTIYYGVLGSWYWTSFQGGRFLGAYWFDEVETVSYVYVSVFTYTCILFHLFGLADKNNTVVNQSNNLYGFGYFIALLSIILGCLSSAYVYIVGAGLHGSLTTDPYLLIFYQISDLAIAAILFGVSLRDRHYKYWIIILFIFVMYSIYTGLRYKIAILVGPLILTYFFDDKVDFKRKIIAAVCVLFVVLFFSLMTLVRSKFSGLNVEELNNIDYDRMLYGLFAETNGVFALSSVINNYGNSFSYVLFEPFLEIFEQFIPRFLYPEKDLYGHLKDFSYGIAYTDESMRSGTAVPFFGEYYAMFGWGGIALGVLLYSILVRWMISFVFKWSVTKYQFLVGVSFICIYMGFYYYSRGSMAQISKGILFVVLPYFIMLRLQNVKGILLR
ncbi:O-antigen polymerase [Neptuniibacter sp. PT8_73]|uniref:O-antigen polymerase n=1 Tax=unclassified Neptuniibacter TaxID=2630693 RepID=UPI0039F66568